MIIDGLESLDMDYDENHNYFQIGMQPVNIEIGNDIELFGDHSYQTLSLVPSNIIGESQEINEICSNVSTHMYEKNSTEISDDNDAIDDKGNSIVDEEPIADKAVKSDKRDDSVMIWEDLRPMFSCGQCSYGTKKRYLLLRHIKTHCNDNDNINEKSNLDKAAESDENYHKSIKCENNDDESTAIVINNSNKKDDIDDDDRYEKRCKFTCDDCSYITNKRYLLLRHIRKHSGCRPHKCTVCDRWFTTATSLQAHVNMHYGIKNKICKYCEKSFTTSGELNRHVKYKHTHEKPYKCTECDYAAVERSKLQRHLRYHFGERPYQCQHCSYASQDKYQLSRHLRTHTREKPYKCDNCGSSYAYSTSLKLHKRVHNSSETKVHSCELCPAKATSKSALRQHIKRMHFSDKPFDCKRCGDTFFDRYSYSLHKKTHESENCFKCQLCSFAAKKLVQFKTHMMTHIQKKPIDCDQTVLTSFSYRNQCDNKTYLQKEKLHECRKCKRTFPYKACLIRHETVHDKEHTSTQE